MFYSVDLHALVLHVLCLFSCSIDFIVNQVLLIFVLLCFRWLFTRFCSLVTLHVLVLHVLYSLYHYLMFY